MRSKGRLVFAFASGLIAASFAAASLHPQSTLYVQTSPATGGVCSASGCGVELLVIDPEAHRVVARATTTHTNAARRAYVTPDGRYLVWAGVQDEVTSSALLAYDSATGSTVTLMPLDAFPFDFAGDPNEPEVFVRMQTGVIGVSASGVRPLPTCAGAALSAMSADGRRFATPCGSPVAPPQSVEIREVASGAVVNQIEVVAFVMALNAMGTELFAIAQVGFSSGELRRYDVATGAVLSARPLATVSDTLLEVDPRTGRLILAQGDRPFGGFGNVEVLDPATLNTIGTILLGLGSRRFAFDDTRARAYVLTSSITESPVVGPVYHTRLDVVDTDAFAVIEGTPLPYERGDAIVLAPRLGTPVDLSADVSGSRVSLAWSPGPSRATTTHYVVEARLDPGGTPLVTLDVVEPSLSVEAVPAGRYFVRVRAVNYGGSSAPSDEIVVDVP